MNIEMHTFPDKFGVIYRTGLEAEDYDEAIEALRAAKTQPEHLSECCTVCCDTGHTASHCHHNPLVMARRAAATTKVWRCYHCDEVFTDYAKAEEHFGPRDKNPRPACQTPQGDQS